MRILEDAARRNPRVLADPEPKAYLVRFADSGIELELGFWISDPQAGSLNIKSDINQEIWREFKRAGIEIPYPQQEVHLLNLEGMQRS
jgi:small-conductance mechanosensitive channel